MTKKKSSKNASSKVLRSSPPRLPASWDDISVGDLVLSDDEDPAEGYWQALVVKRSGDKITLQWQYRSIRRPFVKDLHSLALICGPDGRLPRPHQATDTAQAGEGSFYEPVAGGMYLAREDGPVRQWWPALALEVNEDTVTLQWFEYPDVPPVQRQKSNLAVTYKNAENPPEASS